MSQFNIIVHRLTLNELYPSSKAAMLIHVTIPSLLSRPLYLIVSTFAVMENNTLVIESVFIYSTSAGVLCTINPIRWMMFLISTKIRNGLPTQQIPLKTYIFWWVWEYIKTAKFGKMHAVVAESNNRTVEYKLSLNSPMLLHDTKGKISSELNEIVAIILLV